MRKKKSASRRGGKAVKPGGKASELKRRLAAIDRQARLLKARLVREDRTARLTASKAVRTFRPRKTERDSIVFVSTTGKRLAGRAAGRRKGYAVHVTRSGRKTLVKGYDRRTKKTEKTVRARKFSSLDISRVRSKTARKKFLTLKLNKVAAGKIKRKEKNHIAKGGTQFFGELETDSFHRTSGAVKKLSEILVKAVNGQKSKKDFLVSIGLALKDKSGAPVWVETQQRISRRDDQTLTYSEASQFLGKVVYAFLARELADLGLVSSGSAKFVSRRKENKGENREDWTNGGVFWSGAGKEVATVTKIEYRIDQIGF